MGGLAAEEAGISRVYAGIHFMSGNLKGRAVGECVAGKVDALNWRRQRLEKRTSGDGECRRRSSAQ